MQYNNSYVLVKLSRKKINLPKNEVKVVPMLN
jgi:hypothetical protein